MRKNFKFIAKMFAVALMLFGGVIQSSVQTLAAAAPSVNILAEGKRTLTPVPASVQPGGNVSVHALVVCTPAAGLYENPDSRRKIRNLPYGKKIGFRKHVNAEWSLIEVYGAPSEGRWGFIRRSCVGSLNSW